MLLPLWILALLSLAVGVYFDLRGHVPNPELRRARARAGWHRLAVVVALAGIGLAWLTYQRGAIHPSALASLFGPIRRAALAKFWIDDFFEGVLAAGTLALLPARWAGSTAISWTACSTS